jgi:hypothetical protein
MLHFTAAGTELDHLVTGCFNKAKMAKTCLETISNPHGETC